MNLALNCWTVTILFYLLFNLWFIIEQDLLQTIRLFISERDGEPWLAFDNSWAWRRLKHLSWNRGELCCAHLNGGAHRCFLACSDWAQGPPLLHTERSLLLPGCRTVGPVLRILFSRLLMLLSFQPLSGNYSTASCTIPLWQIEKFSWFCFNLNKSSATA